jgi:nitrate reductase gamma subunit
MYAFLTGPALWVTFIIFIGGLVMRVAFLAGLSRERDRVFYNHAEASWALKSIIHWLLPMGSVSLRQQPLFALVFFVFHVCLLAVPLFLNAHNTLWDESFGVSLWSMSDTLADILAMVVIGCGIFLFIRRLVRPEVRILTSAWDYTLILLTLAPFVTGVLAYHQWGPYETILILHVLFAEVLLIVIPFSKLGHIILFFFTRSFIGFEMGGRRGARSW